MVGMEMLQRLHQFPPAIATLLAAYANDFLYGCLAADIIVGKKFTHYLLNCHRWRAGERLLQAAATDQERACAWGYLCHLAADVVAHNYYVPYKIIRSFDSVALRHTYWELRFESAVEAAVWERAREVCRNGRALDDSLLRTALTPTLFSFGTSKRIFNSIMLLSRLERWQLLIRTMAAHSRHSLSDQDRAEHLELTFDTVSDLLQNGESALCRLADPTGEAALEVAAEMRRHLRFLYKSGHISRAGGVERAEFLKPSLRRAILRPELLELMRTDCHHYSTPYLMTDDAAPAATPPDP